MPTKLLDILVCPQCKGKLAQVEGGQGLLCKNCQLKYPVKDSIPIMLPEEAFNMRTGDKTAPSLTRDVPTSPTHAPVGTATQVFLHRVQFRVVQGPDEGMSFDLSMGVCRAMGRASADTGKTTSVLNVDWAITLDEEIKNLILEYTSQQFRKSKPVKTGDPHHLGAFRRGPDVIFNDNTLSRLHAMLFFDQTGIGVLDLVSKNGTFVNGEEIESRLLKKGDAIEVGETKVIFEG